MPHDAPNRNPQGLNIEQVEIAFTTKRGTYCALKDVNLRIRPGEFVSVIGHSGCGKSTLLNIVAGLVRCTWGGVILQNREVNEPGPDRAVIFQNHSLLPWLTVYGNVRLAVDQVYGKSKSKTERDEWTRTYLQRVHMDHALYKYPNELSGGMKQRVGIARALSMKPKVLLMDEPMGALDALTRASLQDSIQEIHQSQRCMALMITHDVDEAILLSDRVVMMSNGPAATIHEILDIDLSRPRNRMELADHPRYIQYRSHILRFLYDHHIQNNKLAC